MADNEESRRDFLNMLLVGGLGVMGLATAYPMIRFIIPPELPEATSDTVVAAQVGELPPNSGKIFKFGSKPGILINTGQGKLKAFSAVCTHLQCTVQYSPEHQDIWCACHNGHFDLNGQVVSGPPPSPLAEYQVSVRGSDIVVSKGNV